MDSPETEQAREPNFTQGFGSFDFFPYEYECESLPRAISTQSLEGRGYSTLGGPTDPFPLMSLPVEIRWKIYRFWLARLFSSRIDGVPPGASNSGICFRLSDSGYDPTTQVDHHGHILYAVGDPGQRGTPSLQLPSYVDPWLESANQSRAGGAMEDGSVGSEESIMDTSSDDSSDTGSDQNDGAADISREPRRYELNIERSMHPVHDCKYCGTPSSLGSDAMSEENYWNLDDCSCDYRSPNDYEDVRILAHVSRAFTKDLGECIWHGSTLDVLCAEVLIPFLRDRPAVVPLIKGVILHVEYWGFAYETLTETIKEICDFVLENMQLAFFTLYVDTGSGNDGELQIIPASQAEDGASDGTAALKKLKREWEEPLKVFTSKFSGFLGVQMS